MHLNTIPERQSARLSKITNDGLTRSGTGCFIHAVHAIHAYGNRQQWASKGWCRQPT